MDTQQKIDHILSILRRIESLEMNEVHGLTVYFKDNPKEPFRWVEFKKGSKTGSFMLDLLGLIEEHLAE